MALDALAIVEEQGVARIVAHVSQKGADAEAVVPDIVARSVMAIPVSKRMRWGRSRHEFLRPVQWLVLDGRQTLPQRFSGYRVAMKVEGTDSTTTGAYFFARQLSRSFKSCACAL